MDAEQYARNASREFFGAGFKELGAKTEVLWRGGHSQRIRFEQILRIFPDLSGRKIVDVGCGW